MQNVHIGLLKVKLCSLSRVNFKKPLNMLLTWFVISISDIAQTIAAKMFTNSVSAI